MSLSQDVLLGKLSIIQNCLQTINQVTKNKDIRTLSDIFVQDVVIINLQRSIQACIDIANHLISNLGLGVPASYAQAFITLKKNAIISSEMADTMRKMVAFRNISVHEYRKIDPKILELIVEHHLQDLENFALVALKAP